MIEQDIHRREMEDRRCAAEHEGRHPRCPIGWPALASLQQRDEHATHDNQIELGRDEERVPIRRRHPRRERDPGRVPASQTERRPAVSAHQDQCRHCECRLIREQDQMVIGPGDQQERRGVRERAAEKRQPDRLLAIGGDDAGAGHRREPHERDLRGDHAVQRRGGPRGDEHHRQPATGNHPPEQRVAAANESEPEQPHRDAGDRAAGDAGGFADPPAVEGILHEEGDAEHQHHDADDQHPAGSDLRLEGGRASFADRLWSGTRG